MGQPLSQCDLCIHLQPGVQVDGVGACKAFPQGIPREVYGNDIAHNTPLRDLVQEGDYVFTPNPGGNLPFLDDEGGS